MAITIHFTPNLARHVECPALSARGKTVREALDSGFAQNPKVRDFVLDERGALRKHMTLFVDGEQIADRENLSDAVRDGAEIWVMQALSGG